MPDTQNRNEDVFAKYNAMSTEELQQILREDASKPEGQEETSTEALFYIMEVLAQRRRARNEGKTPEEALEVMREIEAACKLKFTDIVNNSNLGSETDADTMLQSLDYIEKLSEISGLPVFLHTAKSDIAGQLSRKLPNVMALTLQEKYFDLPEQKPQARPLFG